jgi:hypothetical protein
LFEPKSKEEKMAQMFWGIRLWGLTRVSHKYLPIQSKQTDIESNGQTDKQTNKQTNGQTDIQKNNTKRQTNKKKRKKTEKQTDNTKQTDKQTREKEKNKETNKQTNRQAIQNKHTKHKTLSISKSLIMTYD